MTWHDYVRPSDQEKVEIKWIRGRDPIFELFSKTDKKKALVKQPMDGFKVPGIHEMLMTHGFQPSPPVIDRKLRLYYNPSPARGGDPLMKFVTEIIPDRGGYVRQEDGEQLELVERGGSSVMLEILDKATGKVIKSDKLGNVGLETLDGVLAVFGYLPVQAGTIDLAEKKKASSRGNARASTIVNSKAKAKMEQELKRQAPRWSQR